jgi:DNA (cytosine-5)-methyltransferase 1
MSKPRLLDLFCGAGGAAVGYHRAGFEVVGVDIKPQPRYPFDFYRGSALDALADGEFLAQFDAIHASPPCQAYSATKTMWNAQAGHPELVSPTRARLQAAGVPWVIENVPGAPLCAHVVLCGSMFSLHTEDWELRRHRLFELDGFACMTPPCSHNRPVLGVYGGHARDRRRVLGVYGNGGGGTMTRGTKATIDQARAIMDIDWMTTAEISQAIPPAYTEHIGGYLLAEVERRAVLVQEKKAAWDAARAALSTPQEEG